MGRHAPRTFVAVALGVALASGIPAHAGLFDWIKKAEETVKDVVPATTSAAGAGELSRAEMVDGLKQALSVGADRAISAIGQPGGFATDELIRIAVPDHLQKLASGLRRVGQGQLVDQFEASMNSAAESAVNEALPIFSNAIADMSVDDAVGILRGPDNAATEYFREKTSGQLQQRIAPLVEHAMQASDVNRHYQSLLGAARSMDRFGLLGLVIPEGADDIGGYVTDKTLDGTFAKLALEEQLIRENPAARSTELLKKVFAARN